VVNLELDAIAGPAAAIDASEIVPIKNLETKPRRNENTPSALWNCGHPNQVDRLTWPDDEFVPTVSSPATITAPEMQLEPFPVANHRSFTFGAE
jgi:hypothetical protein